MEIMRAFLHIGLALLLTVAPALCCCKLRVLIPTAGSSDSGCPTCVARTVPTSPRPADALPACCRPPVPARKSCCEVVAETAPRTSIPATSVPAPAKPAPKPHQCQCCAEHPPATPPDTRPALAGPEPTAEFLPAAFLSRANPPIEHLGLLGGLDPPERAGVDTRYQALFVRHVLRC